MVSDYKLNSPIYNSPIKEKGKLENDNEVKECKSWKKYERYKNY